MVGYHSLGPLSSPVKNHFLVVSEGKGAKLFLRAINLADGCLGWTLMCLLGWQRLTFWIGIDGHIEWGLN